MRAKRIITCCICIGLAPTSILLLTGFSGCSNEDKVPGDDLLDDEASSSTIVRVIGAALEEDCPNGGVVIGYGIDENFNGTLITPRRSMAPRSFVTVKTVKMVHKGQQGEQGEQGSKAFPVRLVLTPSHVLRLITAMVPTPSPVQTGPV